MAGGCIFGHKGPAAFVEGDDRQALLALAAITNSRPFAALVEVQMAFGSYEVGVIQRTPVPALTPSDRDPLAGLALRAWSLKRTLDTRTETSHAFVLTSLLQVGEPTLIARAQAWQTRVVEAEAQLARLQDEVDERCFGLYNIDLEDRGRIERRFGAPGDAEGYEEDGEADELDEEPEEVDPAPMIASLLSWAFGVVLGRFDVRLATGDREPPPEPEPFDPLPACSPGMLTGDDGLPLATPPAGYPIAFPRDGILVDDEGHDRDLVASVQRVFELTFDDAPTRWREAAEVLDERNPDLRSWFAKSFFEFHVKRYSKSRRKAPIYWQLATPSASYSVWLYYHRFTRDTLFTLLKDHVAPKLQHEERKLAGLTQEVGSNPTVAQRREIEAQEQFVAELRSFRDEVARVAPLWNPNLNDGVLINFAPLWRLVPQHRSWQRECKATWDKLCSGDYDWAHLAMHFWPERVVPKCAEDRSLAIAHGLEDIFWYEDADGKWQARDVESAEIERLIEERTSSAVEDALKSLLEAPVPSGSRGRGRGRRASKLSRRPKVPTGGRASTVQRSERRRLTAELLRRVKEAIAANGDGATKADVLKATGIAASDWNSAIQALLADGSVRRTGERRGARYHLVESDG